MEVGIHYFKLSCIFGVKLLSVKTFIIIIFSHLLNILSLLIGEIFTYKVHKNHEVR